MANFFQCERIIKISYRAHVFTYHLILTSPIHSVIALCSLPFYSFVTNSSTQDDAETQNPTYSVRHADDVPNHQIINQSMLFCTFI